MIATSTVVMFGLMYLNTYALDHVVYSQTRTWMAVVMGADDGGHHARLHVAMYKNRRANIAILVGSVVVFAGALWLVRSQETVDDVSYMKAMIPHHSIAIMTSERAHIKDREVRKLADEIIEAQVREIAEMKRLIARLEAHPDPERRARPSLLSRQAGSPTHTRDGRERRGEHLTADPLNDRDSPQVSEPVGRDTLKEPGINTLRRE